MEENQDERKKERNYNMGDQEQGQQSTAVVEVAAAGGGAATAPTAAKKLQQQAGVCNGVSGMGVELAKRCDCMIWRRWIGVSGPIAKNARLTGCQLPNALPVSHPPIGDRPFDSL